MDEKEMNGIVIKGEYHEAVQWDLEGFKCHECSLYEVCDYIATCTLSDMSLCGHITDNKLSVFVNRGKVKIEKV